MSGNVTVTGAHGNVDVSSVSGDVRLDKLHADGVRATSVSGDVDVQVDEFTGRGDLVFHSVSGDITLDAPRSFDADISMSTVSGEINSDFPLVAQRRPHAPSQRRGANRQRWTPIRCLNRERRSPNPHRQVTESNPTMKRSLLALALTVAVAALPAAAQQRQTDNGFNWSGKVPAGRWIRIVNLNGAITVGQASGDNVEVTATKQWRRGDPAVVRIETQKFGPNNESVMVCALWGERATCDERGYEGQQRPRTAQQRRVRDVPRARARRA